MALKLDLENLKGLLESFYTLTGLKAVLIDYEYNEILSCPVKSQDFCEQIKRRRETKGKCEDCLKEYCRICKDKGDLHIYRCHLGLTEAIFPIKEKDITVGFIMFGQTTEHEDKEDLIKNVRENYLKYGDLTEELKKDLEKIKVRSHKEIVAAAEILKTIANYIAVKKLVSKNADSLLYSVYEYIDAHVYQRITADEIAKALYVCRTTLFDKIRKELPEGLNELINRRKIEASKYFLTSTNLSLKDIAEKLAFSDSNYYSKVFKKFEGITPKSYRKQKSE